MQRTAYVEYCSTKQDLPKPTEENWQEQEELPSGAEQMRNPRSILSRKGCEAVAIAGGSDGRRCAASPGGGVSLLVGSLRAAAR